MVDTSYISQDVKDSLRMKVLNELKERYKDIPELTRCIDKEIMEYELAENDRTESLSDEMDMFSTYYRLNPSRSGDSNEY